jgi:hypothetical protein
LTKKQLTKEIINVKSFKTADNNFLPMILSYFLPCIEFYKKDLMFLSIWIFLFLLVVLINKSSYHYIPILKFMFGYRYYEIQTTSDVTFTMLTKQKLINKNQLTSYSEITDYVILDQSKKP